MRFYWLWMSSLTPEQNLQKFSIAFSLIKLLYFDANVTDICFQGSSWQTISIGLGFALAQTDDKLYLVFFLSPLFFRFTQVNAH